MRTVRNESAIQFPEGKGPARPVGRPTARGCIGNAPALSACLLAVHISPDHSRYKPEDFRGTGVPLCAILIPARRCPTLTSACGRVLSFGHYAHAEKLFECEFMAIHELSQYVRGNALSPEAYGTQRCLHRTATIQPCPLRTRCRLSCQQARPEYRC